MSASALPLCIVIIADSLSGTWQSEGLQAASPCAKVFALAMGDMNVVFRGEAS